MSKNDGGPVSPTYRKSGTYPHDINPMGGMSLRDYFAAHCPFTFTEFMGALVQNDSFKQATSADMLQRYCTFRFEYADAMIKAREATHEA